MESGQSPSITGTIQGLYQQKRSGINMLTDPQVLAHLMTLHQDAQNPPEGDDECKRSCDVVDELLDQLKRNITSYNIRNQLGKFTVLHTEGFNFEGAMRFYLEDGKHKTISKAVKLTNKTNVEALIPMLTDKFNISKHDKRKKVLYQIQASDEILLSPEECPLDIAVNSKRTIRFVMRLQKMEQQQSEHSRTGDHSRQRKVLSRFFGVDNSDLNAPFASSASAVPSGKSVEQSALKRQGTVDSISSSSSSGSIPRSDKPGALSGLLLKTPTPRYRSRVQSNEEMKSDSGTPSMKRKSAKMRLRTTSLSSMLVRSMSFRTDSKHSKELSTEESTPGLLKVFGSHISPESQYKSVLATRQSCATELIKEVLERYSLPRDSYEDYVLCDVIGNFQTASVIGRKSSLALTNMRDERIWVTECLRALRDNERPLELSSYWKPEDGYLRRFEIRKRSEVESKVVDNVTHGINVNAKRIQMTHSHAHTIDVPDSHSSLPEMEGLEIDEDIKKPSPRRMSTVAEVPETRSSTPDAKRRVSEKEETESSDEPTAVYNLSPPRDCPYLLTLKGRDPETDLILYLLHQQVCLIGGSHDNKESTEHLVVDITLEAPDIMPHHCWIFQRQVSNLSNMDESEYSISIEPVNDAGVTVNGTLISGNTQLTSGDIICVGQHYMFMFKDPSTEQREIEIQDFHPPPPRQSHENVDSPKESRLESQHAQPLIRHSPEGWVAPSAYVNKKAQQYYANVKRLKLSYCKDKEDAVLDYIGSMQQGRDGRGFGLAPAYLLAMCVEHAAYSYDQEHTKALVMRVAALVHSLAWDKTKELASKQPKKLTDVHKVLRTLLPHLRTIMFWMANALELLNFFHTNMKNYIGQVESKEETGEEPSLVVSIQDEITAELEEVVMYTFQQSVYYLTKTLYIALPNILDTNPFLDEEKGQDERSQGMEEVLHVFQTTFDMLYNLDVHPQITSQLFAYLLFFTNASLFNMLMERGSSDNFFKWSKGAQIRGNLDTLESWLQDHGLREQLHFLNRVSMAVDLLATPKLQLMQADWNSIRHDFTSLNASQLQQILRKYHLGTNQTRPKGWFPPHDQVESALRSDDILESFDNHPPLVLPNTDFKLDLQHTPSDPNFRLQVQRLCKAVTEVTVHLGQPTEHKLFSPRFNSTSLDSISTYEQTSIPSDSPLLCRSNSAPMQLSSLDGTREIASSNYGGLDAPTSPSYRRRQRKLSRVLEAEANVENSESSSEGVRTITMTMSPPVPMTHPPAISVTPPNHDRGVVLMESEPQLLEPPVEFANDDDNAEAEGFSVGMEQEEVKYDGRAEGTDKTSVKDENENHKPRLEDIGRTDSTSSSFDDSIDEQQIRMKDRKDSLDDVFVVDLEKCEDSLGLGLIDGMHTQLRSPGIYVRKLVANGPAVKDGRLKLGDRILAVNGTSLVGADYHSAMHLIRSSGQQLRFLVAKSETAVTMKITSSSC